MAEANRELKIVDSAEAQGLREAIFDAVDAYSSFLDRQGLIFSDNPVDPEGPPRLKAEALVVTHDYGGVTGIDITLKDGAPYDGPVYGDGDGEARYSLKCKPTERMF